MYDEIVKFLSAVTDYEAVNGEWTVDDIADIADTTLLKHLIKLGYPPQKIKWYRGGMHDWLTLSMTSTRGQ